MRRLLGFGVTTTGLSLLLLASAAGCGDARQKPSPAPPRAPSAVDAKADEHGHETVRQEFHTLAEGVAALKEHYGEIKTAYARGEAEKAHEPLHKVGNVLEALPELGKSAGLSAANLEKLNQSVAKMFEAYGNIDDAVHRNKEADYQAVAEQVDQSMTAISSLLASPPPADQ